MRLRVSTIVVTTLLCLAPTASWADLTPYSQDFEGLDPADPNALGNDPAPFPGGWVIWANVYGPDWNWWYNYGQLYPAPNNSGGFSSVAVGQGGPEQGAQQLVVYNDYNNFDMHAHLWAPERSNAPIVEANVYQERPIGAADVGTTWVFEFDAKRGDIGAESQAAAFIKTIDPASGYATTNNIQVPTTAIPYTWDRYVLSIYIDPGLQGQLLQFGFVNWASHWEPSGVFYDNVSFNELDPRGAGFWKHQCSDLGFTQVSPAELVALFADVVADSCVPAACSVLDFEPPLNDMRAKANRQALSLWLNVTSGRLPGGWPIDLPGLTTATTVGEAMAEIDATLCDPLAGQSALESAKNIAEALSLNGEDMGLVSTTSSLAVKPGQRVTITLGLVNMSPYAESYSLTTSADWPVSLSRHLVTALGGGQVAVLTVDVYVPGTALKGEKAQLRVTAEDLFSEVGLQRQAVIDFEVRGQGGRSRNETGQPVQHQQQGVQYKLRPGDE